MGVGVAIARNFVGWDTSISHDSNEKVPALRAGDTVFVSSGASLGKVFKYIGALTLNDVDLSAQDYENNVLWVQVARPPVQEVRAYTQNTSIDAEGDLLDPAGHRSDGGIADAVHAERSQVVRPLQQGVYGCVCHPALGNREEHLL